MDRELKIAIGDSNHALRWVNKTISFDELCERLKTTIRTSESAEEYAKAPKPVRDKIKDRGGFVGGALRGGRRKRDHVECRSMVILDADEAPESFITDYSACPGRMISSGLPTAGALPRIRASACSSERQTPKPDTCGILPATGVSGL